MSSSEKPKLLKVVLLGDPGVGKTCLVGQFANKEFFGAPRHTVGVEFRNKDISVDGRLYTLQIWDTAGQERFKSLRTPFYRGTDICLLTFAVDNKASFENLTRWKNEFTYYADVQNDRFPFVLLGNKSDFTIPGISNEEIEQWCMHQHDMPFFRTSAKTAENVHEAFYKAVKVYRELEENETFQIDHTQHTIKLKKPDKKKGCKC